MVAGAMAAIEADNAVAVGNAGATCWTGEAG